jgi:hypothetical protein
MQYEEITTNGAERSGGQAHQERKSRFRSSNGVSKDVEIRGAIALIHEALGVLGSGWGCICGSWGGNHRGLNFSVLVPFVEGGYVNHLQLTVIGVGQGQSAQETREHRSFGGVGTSSAGQSGVVGAGSTNGSIVEAGSQRRDEIDAQLLSHCLVLLVHGCLQRQKAIAVGIATDAHVYAVAKNRVPVRNAGWIWRS